MPFYEFVCSVCGEKREKFYRVIPRVVPNKVNITCNNCGSIKKHNKVPSLSSFHLKQGGVGWAKEGYSTDIQAGSKVVSLTEPR